MEKEIKLMEVPGIEPGAFHMRSERDTTTLHPQCRESCKPSLTSRAAPSLTGLQYILRGYRSLIKKFMVSLRVNSLNSFNFLIT